MRGLGRERPPEDVPGGGGDDAPHAAECAELGAEEVRALARGEDDARGERVHGDGRDDARLGARGEEEVGEVLVEGRGLALVRPELGEEVRVERARRGEEGVELVGLVEVVRRRVLRACGARGARGRTRRRARSRGRRAPRASRRTGSTPRSPARRRGRPRASSLFFFFGAPLCAQNNGGVGRGPFPKKARAKREKG